MGITCLCVLYPLALQVYIVKLGFTGVCIIFLIFALKHRLLVPVRTVLMSTHNLCFEGKLEKYLFFQLKIVIFYLRCIMHLGKLS